MEITLSGHVFREYLQRKMPCTGECPILFETILPGSMLVKSGRITGLIDYFPAPVESWGILFFFYGALKLVFVILSKFYFTFDEYV
jgi:hypothetical protein